MKIKLMLSVALVLAIGAGMYRVQACQPDDHNQCQPTGCDISTDHPGTCGGSGCTCQPAG